MKMKKIINYFKSLRVSTIYKAIGIILFIGIVIWLVIITNKINSLATTKTSANTNVNSVDSNSDIMQNNINDKDTDDNNSEEILILNNSNISENNDTSMNADLIVLTYFNETEKELENAAIREQAKEKFITIIDFLFYNGKIKGCTFNEVSTITKLKILQIALSIDVKIETYFPGYKETITSTTNKAYTSIKELIVKKYLELTTSICAKDPETCASAKQDFQDMKKSFSITWDLIKNLTSSGVTNLKDWYEIYSGK